MLTKGERVEALIKSEKSYAEAAAKVGVDLQYAYKISHYGGYQGYLAHKRLHYHTAARRNGIPQGRGRSGAKKQYNYDTAAVIAAVDKGMSYREVAERFGITRSVVAGAMNRRARAA